MKKLEGEYRCSRCKNNFTWHIVVEKPKYSFFTEALAVNCKHYEAVYSKYIIHLNCPVCGHSDVIEQA